MAIAIDDDSVVCCGHAIDLAYRPAVVQRRRGYVRRLVRRGEIYVDHPDPSVAAYFVMRFGTKTVWTDVVDLGAIVRDGGDCGYVCQFDLWVCSHAGSSVDIRILFTDLHRFASSIAIPARFSDPAAC